MGPVPIFVFWGLVFWGQAPFLQKNHAPKEYN